MNKNQKIPSFIKIFLYGVLLYALIILIFLIIKVFTTNQDVVVGKWALNTLSSFVDKSWKWITSIFGIVEILDIIRNVFKDRKDQKPSDDPLNSTLFQTIKTMNVPAPAVNFVGRDTEIEQIYTILQKSNITIWAMGGVGKTEVVKAYVNKYEKEYQKIGWFVFDESIENTLINYKKLPDIKNKKQAYQYIIEELANFDKDTLIIFDNVTNLSQSDINCLIQLRCRVILTARRTFTMGAFENYEIDFLSNVDCQRLFMKNASIELQEQDLEPINEIIQRAGQHTLTIELLAKIYKKSSEIDSITDLQNLLKEKSFDIQQEIKIFRNDETKGKPLFEHLTTLYDISEIKNKQAKYILKNLCLLPNISIPKKKIIEWLELNKKGKKQLEILQQLGWIKIENKSITLHNVLAETLKLSLTPSFEDCKPLVQSLAQEINFESFDIDRYNPRFFLHVQAIAQYFSAQQTQQESLASLYHNIAFVYHAQGDYSQTLVFYQKDLAIREKVLGKEHPDTATTYNDLAGVYYAKGDYPQALVFYEKSLVIREKVLGKELPDTATTYNNIAGVYRAQGDYPKALAGYQKALVIREKVLGKQHPDTATTYNNIAGVYRAQGDHPQALAFYQKALAIQEKVLGKEHPDTAATYNNIAGVYYDKGDCSQALAFYQKALAINEKVLGKEHPDKATTYNNIALVYRAQGDYPQALAFYQKALEIKEKVLGKEHPDTATTYHNLAGVYYVKEDYPRALVWYQKALEIKEKVLGKQHPDTATTYDSIALVYYVKEDYPQALTFYQKAIVIREKVLGKEHLDTATTYHNIALVYKTQGDYPEALKGYQKSLAIYQKVLGKEHPYTATTYHNIALVYKAQGDYPQALAFYEKDLAISEKVLGKEHPDTATSYNNIAGICQAQGDYPQALEWYQKAVLVFYKRLGEAHPNTKIVRDNMQSTYLALDHTEQEFNQYFSDLLSNLSPPRTQED